MALRDLYRVPWTSLRQRYELPGKLCRRPGNDLCPAIRNIEPERSALRFLIFKNHVRRIACFTDICILYTVERIVALRGRCETGLYAPGEGSSSGKIMAVLVVSVG